MRSAAANVYVIAAATCVGFAIWASLLPFHFHAASFPDFGGLFRSAGPVGRPAFSLTDIVSNFLLFAPIGLFAAGAFERTWPGRSATALVVVGGTLLSVAVELGQAFVPWRTPSALDVLAEAAGAVAGLALWRVAATELDTAVAAVIAVWRRSTTGERLLFAYAAAFAWAWLLPFDFTLRPDEIGDKFDHKRLLLPFMPSPDAASPSELRLTFAAAVPLGWAGAVCGCAPGSRRSVMRATLGATLCLLILTLAQVPVFSRTTDATMVVAALPGVLLGAAAARVTNRPVGPGRP